MWLQRLNNLFLKLRKAKFSQISIELHNPLQISLGVILLFQQPSLVPVLLVSLQLYQLSAEHLRKRNQKENLKENLKEETSQETENLGVNKNTS